MVIITFITLFIVSFIAALRSMKDFSVPREVNTVLNSKQLRGTIVFFKDKVMHYSSESSSASRSE